MPAPVPLIAISASSLSFLAECWKSRGQSVGESEKVMQE